MMPSLRSLAMPMQQARSAPCENLRHRGRRWPPESVDTLPAPYVRARVGRVPGGRLPIN